MGTVHNIYSRNGLFLYLVHQSIIPEKWERIKMCENRGGMYNDLALFITFPLFFAELSKESCAAHVQVQINPQLLRE